MSKYSHLPSSANTPFGRVIYEVEATLIKATTSTSSNLSVTRSVKFTRCHARTTPRAGLRMVNGCTKNGLFQYEITLPKELHVDQQQHLRLCVKLTYDNLLKLPFSIEEVQLNLKEERVYL